LGVDSNRKIVHLHHNDQSSLTSTLADLLTLPADQEISWYGGAR